VPSKYVPAHSYLPSLCCFSIVHLRRSFLLLLFACAVLCYFAFVSLRLIALFAGLLSVYLSDYVVCCIQSEILKEMVLEAANGSSSSSSSVSPSSPPSSASPPSASTAEVLHMSELLQAVARQAPPDMDDDTTGKTCC
jgi:hypothetical protein